MTNRTAIQNDDLKFRRVGSVTTSQWIALDSALKQMGNCPIEASMHCANRIGFKIKAMNRKILGYLTASDTDTGKLDKQVDAFVQQGYQPYGAPHVVPGEKILICQAIGRHEEMGDWKLSADNPL
jgi:hypothetical protein